MNIGLQRNNTYLEKIWDRDIIEDTFIIASLKSKYINSLDHIQSHHIPLPEYGTTTYQNTFREDLKLCV